MTLKRFKLHGEYIYLENDIDASQTGVSLEFLKEQEKSGQEDNVSEEKVNIGEELC